MTSTLVTEFKNTELGKIPLDWNVFRLEELCSIRKTKNVKSELYIGLEHIGQRNNQLVAKGNIKNFTSNKNVFLKGDVLYGKLRPLLNKVYLTEEDGYCSTDILPLVSNEKLSNKILLWTLTSERFVNCADSNSSGTKMPRTNWNDIKNYLIPLGDIDEQLKIASILSKVDALIQKTDQIIEQTQRLRICLMQRLLTKGIGHTKLKTTEIGEIPDDWKILRLEELCKIERGKFTHRPRDDPDFYDGKYPFIQTGDVEKSDGYIRTFTQTLNQKGLSVSKLFPEGVIAITIAANIGSVAITTFPVCFPDSVVGISSNIMDTKFLAIYLQTKKSFLKGKATVNAQANINLETLKPLLTPVPSLSEQKKIAAIILSTESKVQLYRSLKDKIRSLKAGLMQQLLTGKIRVKI